MKVRIDFEKALLKGRKCYDREVGDWWLAQADNSAHQRAYRNIAARVARRLDEQGAPPRLVVDYGCGNGRFLGLLARRLPATRIVALDGSEKMLGLAGERLKGLGVEADLLPARKAFAAAGPRVRLVNSQLPNFSLPKGAADAVVFVFPNITSSPADQPYYDRHGYRNRRDAALCRVLARLREMDPEDEVGEYDPEGEFESLMTDRVISRNIRCLLPEGGLWMKVDYANSDREGLSELTRMRTSFAEGALDRPVKNLVAERFFAYEGNAFFRSTVILDVYHQTRDPADREGGYFISTFRGV